MTFNEAYDTVNKKLTSRGVSYNSDIEIASRIIELAIELMNADASQRSVDILKKVLDDDFCIQVKVIV